MGSVPHFPAFPDGEMVLNDVGRTVKSVLSELPEHFTNIHLDEYMIMPNHFHGILHINEFVGVVGAKQGCPSLFSVATGEADEALALPLHTVRGSVSGSLCSMVSEFQISFNAQDQQISQQPGCPVWQRNYYERVIRNED